MPSRSVNGQQPTGGAVDSAKHGAPMRPVWLPLLPSVFRHCNLSCWLLHSPQLMLWWHYSSEENELRPWPRRNVDGSIEPLTVA